MISNMAVSSDFLADLAEVKSLSVGLVYDVTADDSERWCASIGLDWSATGATPQDALERAVEDMRHTHALSADERMERDMPEFGAN